MSSGPHPELVRRRRAAGRAVFAFAPVGGVVVAYGRRGLNARKGAESLIATAAKRHRRYWGRRGE